MTAFDRFASETAATKRATLSSGKASGHTSYLTGVACMPLAPVDAETRNRPELQTFEVIKETYVKTGLDIIEGDLLTLGGVDYPIRAVENWPWATGVAYLRLVVEVLKR